MKNNKNSKYYVPSVIQKLFVGVIGAVFTMQLIFFVVQGINQYIDNPNMGGFYGFMFSIMIYPIILFVVAYALNPRSLSILGRSFESMLLAITGTILGSLLSIALPSILIEVGSENLNNYWSYELISFSVLAVLYTATLFWLRSTKRWR